MSTAQAAADGLGSLLPVGVAVAETYDDVLDEPLHPEEVAHLQRVAPRRRAEFCAVRACVRTALAQLGLPRPPMVPGACGEPAWPPGVVGALTHCEGYRAAAVSPAHLARSIGVDAEPHLPLPEGVLACVASTAEQEHLRELASGHPGTRWETVLFSAKESVYKAWFPLTGRWLGFDDAHLVVDPERGLFTAKVPAALTAAREAPPQFCGRWTVYGDHVLTAVSVPMLPPR